VDKISGVGSVFTSNVGSASRKVARTFSSGPTDIDSVGMIVNLGNGVGVGVGLGVEVGGLGVEVGAGAEVGGIEVGVGEGPVTVMGNEDDVCAKLSPLAV